MESEKSFTVTLTWESTVERCIKKLETGGLIGREMARAELLRMGRALDKLVLEKEMAEQSIVLKDRFY